MSEEEMLKNIRKQIENTIKANECGLSNNDFKEDIEALELLHDRYLKEKEKNKKLENADLTTVYINGFYDGEKKWKDKIKEKIENYVIKLKRPVVNTQSIEEYTFGISALQELLEERN